MTEYCQAKVNYTGRCVCNQNEGEHTNCSPRKLFRTQNLLTFLAFFLFYVLRPDSGLLQLARVSEQWAYTPKPLYTTHTAPHNNYR